MSCGGRVTPVNLERPGEPGRWVLPRTRPTGADCQHASEYRNALGIAGGPVVKVCIRCSEVQHPTWAATPVRAALPAAEPFIAGESEWAEAVQERGVA